jgi:hypothetical protein
MPRIEGPAVFAGAGRRDGFVSARISAGQFFVGLDSNAKVKGEHHVIDR